MAEHICESEKMILCGFIASDAPPAREPGRLQSLWWTLERKLAPKPNPTQTPLFDQAKADIPVISETDSSSMAAFSADLVLDLSKADRTAFLKRLGKTPLWHLDVLAEDIVSRSLDAILSKKKLMPIGLYCATAEQTEPVCLARAVVPSKFLVSYNIAFVREKAVALVVRELRNWPSNVETLTPTDEDFPPSGPLRGLRYLGNVVQNLTWRFLSKLQEKRKLRPGMFELRTINGNPLHFSPALAKSHAIHENAYHADPFLWEQNGELYCFFEVLSYADRKGHISCARISDQGLEDVTPIISEDYHLSFPFLFEHNQTLYMIPEPSEAKRLELWRCDSFPDQWTRDRIILDDIIVADSTIINLNDQWWLFTNQSSDPFGDANSELHLYRISGPDFESITPHPQNPVVFDATTARNAGRILMIDGQPYRMSQDNSHDTYGYGLNLMRIEALSMSTYSESLTRKIQPDFDDNLIGCHHLDQRGDTIVFDVRRRLGGHPKKAARSPD
ncbi:MAG: hypothetical protein HRT81_05625 [Henriciella sp.]|nr:hypothetical protein [Henriciella sp.]